MGQTFLAGFLISALGSLPLGVINLSIIQISVNKGFRAAFQFVGIAIVAEYFHVWMAIWLLKYIIQYPIINQYFDWAALVFILIMAVASLTRKTTPLAIQNQNISVLKAISINFLNPFSVPFWLFFTTYALNAGWISEGFNGQIYFLAATLGALVTLSGFAFAGKKLTTLSFFQKLNIDKILGWVFIAMAVWKFVRMVV